MRSASLGARGRQHEGERGVRRVEVTIPAKDTALIKAAAAALRAGGRQAETARKALSSLASGEMAKSGKELVAFFRDSPLVGEELVIERDRGPGRSADFS